MRRKIVLYNPRASFYTMPLGLMAIGSALDPEEFDVRIIDARLHDNAHARVLAEIEDAVCLGVTVLTGAPIADALEILRAAKRSRPELVTVCGGWHPSLFPTDMLSESSIDITVQGQGEQTFAELVGTLLREAPLEKVLGIAFTDGEAARLNAPRPLAAMDDLPRVDYALIDVQRYFDAKGVRQLDYISSVGCPFRCAFCADPFVYGRKWNAISPERVGSELEALHAEYHFDDVNFQDETFFTYRRRVAAIAEEILKRDLGVSWAATLRADQAVRMTPEVFRLCVRSGMRRVLIGVESGSPDMLKRIRKDTTIEQILESAELCAANDVAVIFSFIVGFPGETHAQMMQTLALIKQLRRMSRKFETPVFYYKPYPGSVLSREIVDDMPTSLDEWSRFDYVQGAAGPWVEKDDYRLVERFKFYNQHIWSGRTLLSRPLAWLSRIRCNSDCYALPVEKILVERMRPAAGMS